MTIEKLDMQTPDMTDANVARIAELFPNVVTEGKDESGNFARVIDFDALKQELSGNIVEGPQERYHLDWPGKRAAMLAANTPITKTLRPVRDESVNFNHTQNLFIEGDNLEALKLLQETYLGKVKMIYIDPPYNTGKDFIYKDNFTADKSDYLEDSGQLDKDGGRLVANSESNGRYHSDWLSMMYPRLKLARNLLREDGVIFISIDDGEVAGLRKICDEIFGTDNFLSNVVWQKKFAPQNDAKYLSASHDHILFYARSSESFKIGLLPRTAKADDRYKNPDNDPKGRWASGDLTRAEYRPRDHYEVISPQTGKVFLPPDGNSWRRPADVMVKLIEDGQIWFGETGNNFPRMKRYLSDVKQGITAQTIWERKDVGDTQEGKRLITKYFGNASIFETAKPPRLLHRMLMVSSVAEDDIVLDFFAGSASTAEACQSYKVPVKSILIQLPETTDEKSEASKQGYSTIAEISKERIRLAGARVLNENPEKKGMLDVGFRVLKIDSSNMNRVYYSPSELEQTNMLDTVEHIKADRTPEDLLFQVMLDWGVDLSLPITCETIEGKEVYLVGEKALAACFDMKLTEPLLKAMAMKKPLRAVFRDDGFSTDDMKINAGQLFKQMTDGHTDMKVI
jgi:adenine-specific DNA-methyltransferase